MNWLLYMGGGMIFIRLIVEFFNSLDIDKRWSSAIGFISGLSIWVWIWTDGAMNWMIYIGGGILFIGLGTGFIQLLSEENKKHYWLHFSCFLMVWIWICWRFL